MKIPLIPLGPLACGGREKPTALAVFIYRQEGGFLVEL